MFSNLYVYFIIFENKQLFYFFGSDKWLMESRFHNQRLNPDNSSEHWILTTRTLENSPKLTKIVKVIHKT